MSQRVDAPYLDAFAASFLVLGRLHPVSYTHLTLPTTF